MIMFPSSLFVFFFFNDTATTEIYTLSLHDALPISGVVLELVLIRRLAVRDHLAQVLGSYAVILIANDLVKMVWGPAPVMLNMPAALSGPVQLLPELMYPAYRLMIIVFGLAAALGLYWFVTRTRAGVLVRAGASNRQMATLMGVRVPLLFLGVFTLGAMLAADRKSTRLNSSHSQISYAVFCLKKKKK